MTRTTVWITGAGGRLGSILTRLLKEDPNLKVLATDKEVDVTDPKAVNGFADLYTPNVIINCAALTDPKSSQDNLVELFKVNTLGARNLSAASRKHNSIIMELSTDDIFEGSQGDSFIEFDSPVPVSQFAKSKLAAENYVRELNPKHIIIRSSWVYSGDSDNPNDYYSKVLDNGKNNIPFSASSAQISTPTSAKSLAGFVRKLIDRPVYGTYHASDEGECSRYEYAKEILKLHGLDESLVIEEKGDPCSTKLENLMMKMTELYQMPDWKEDLQDHVDLEDSK